MLHLLLMATRNLSSITVCVGYGSFALQEAGCCQLLCDSTRAHMQQSLKQYAFIQVHIHCLLYALF